MSQTLHIVSAGPQALESKAPQETVTAAKRKHKKQDRLRAAWIAFVGRILAQFIGAAASVVLGLLVVRTYTTRIDHASANPVADRPPIARQTARATAKGAPGTITLAVLPMQDFSAGTPSKAFADALTEELITDLAGADHLRVVSRTSSMRYQVPDRPLPQIAEELGVNVVVEGSIVQADGRVRITAQLIDASTDKHLWARSYDRPLRDTLGLQAEVATAIARDISLALAPMLSDPSNARPATDPQPR